jgi:hypothetical protein
MGLDAPAEVKPPHGKARFAGLMYAIVVVTGMFSLAYAQAQVFAGSSDAEIVRSVFAHEALLRLSIAAELTCYVAFIALALALYKLLAAHGQFAAQLMAALAIVSVPFGFANIANLFEILRAADGQTTESAHAVIIASLDRYRMGLIIQSIPWGAWLAPLGYLVIRCGFLPRILGILLIVTAAGYIVDFLGRLLLQTPYTESLLADIIDRLGISEILFCIWLLVFGARRTLLPRSRKSANAPAA